MPQSNRDNRQTFENFVFIYEGFIFFSADEEQWYVQANIDSKLKKQHDQHQKALFKRPIRLVHDRQYSCLCLSSAKRWFTIWLFCNNSGVVVQIHIRSTETMPNQATLRMHSARLDRKSLCFSPLRWIHWFEELISIDLLCIYYYEHKPHLQIYLVVCFIYESTMKLLNYSPDRTLGDKWTSFHIFNQYNLYRIRTCKEW